jgi:hypothetical protein
MLERDDRRGFRGVQSKTLMDIIQLECLTQSSVILRVQSAVGEGRFWIQRGEIIDAATGDLLGKEAFLEMLRWKAGSFEILPSDAPRPRTIFSSYESLLMETAQTIDESTEGQPIAEGTDLAAYSRFKGVQFVLSVKRDDPTSYEHWAAENPGETAAWIQSTTRAARSLGERLEAGELRRAEGLGPQRHLGVICGGEQDLGVGFTRSAGLPAIREHLKKIEAKWVS